MKKLISKISGFPNLAIHAIRGVDGIGYTYNLSLSLVQFTSCFGISPTDVEEYDRLQRIPTQSRIKDMTKYLLERKNTIFPQVICVVTKAEFEPIEGLDCGNGVNTIGKLSISGDDERQLVDGQGRLLSSQEVMEVAYEFFKGRSIDMKVVVTNTNTLLEASTMIRQIFSDIHKRVKKPNSSINLHFDSSESSSTFPVKAVEHFRDNNLKFDKWISLDGNSNRIWTLAQFKNFLCRFTGLSSTAINTEFANNPEFAKMYINFLPDLLNPIAKISAFKNITADTKLSDLKNENLLCCAIGIDAIGILGNLIITLATNDNTPPDFSPLDKITDIDFSKDSKLFVGTVVDEKGKMIRGSEKSFAKIIACQLGMRLTSELALAQ